MAESKKRVNEECVTGFQKLRKFGAKIPRYEASAVEARTVECETVEIAKHGNGNVVYAEILLCQRLQLFALYRVNRGQNFVQRIEAAEIQFLARQVGHARAGG